PDCSEQASPQSREVTTIHAGQIGNGVTFQRVVLAGARADRPPRQQDFQLQPPLVSRDARGGPGTTTRPRNRAACLGRCSTGKWWNLPLVVLIVGFYFAEVLIRG